ncbi:protein of unknown function [Friedmanniella luteola]|uniref:DUF4261 domain-containing protein n=1 Tax=Friedmanniella luteola TaxID=546871 RepID=A0A1H1Y012_9ACTN|nr:DUF4261 domain-containing protein [Friedmanniella luteola]SDT14814.1 protein of unknown function [Friedmanniella luteola]
MTNPPSTGAGASAGLALVAELWYPEAPDLGDPALLAALRAVRPGTEQQEGSLSVPHPLADPELPPLVTVVLPGSPLGQEGKTLPDVSQTWAWADAEAAVAPCRSSVLVTEVLAAGRTAAERVTSLGEVVAVLVAHTAPRALHWARSQRVSDPATFGAGDLDGVINVRMVGDARDEDALAMDTLGLHVFDLPDVQCHFRDREPGEIAELLFATAVYLFDTGDVIEDGNTISGTDGEGRYVCYREASLLDPARLVLDVDLGEPWSAGRRDRTA